MDLRSGRFCDEPCFPGRKIVKNLTKQAAVVSDQLAKEVLFMMLRMSIDERDLDAGKAHVGALRCPLENVGHRRHGLGKVFIDQKPADRMFDTFLSDLGPICIGDLITITVALDMNVEVVRTVFEID